MRAQEEIRLTQRQKDENDYAWYKQNIKALDHRSFEGYNYFGYTSTWYKDKINYDLYHNKINRADFEYVCKPWGDSVSEDMPAELVNRDICSGKINAIIGLEMQRPFAYQVVATNKEATTRKEKKEFELIQDYVMEQIMTPIRQQLQQQAQQVMQQAQEQGQNLEELEPQIMQQMQEQEAAMTPPEVKKYMARQHQDVAELLGNQILNYLKQKESIEDKFNKGALHAAISAKEVYWIGEVNGEPVLKVVNPLTFDFDKSPDVDYIEDGEWAVAEYRMTPTEIISEFGDELKDDQIDRVYSFSYNYENNMNYFQTEPTDTAFSGNTIRVLHCTWKALRKLGILTYEENEQTLKKYVSENYRIDKSRGDVSIKWLWVPEVHEGYQIMDDIFVRMRPVPNQHKDINNIYHCKLPYVGAVYDNTNSVLTSFMDRLRPYQYLYNILWYRMELAIARDKGKKFAVDMNAIPLNQNLDLPKWQYYIESDSIIYLNSKQEGDRFNPQGIAQFVKEVDMTNTSDIARYQTLLSYIDQQAGESIGVTKTLEGQIQEREAVKNVNQALNLTSNKLEVFFSKRAKVKQNVLQALIESAKVVYTQEDPVVLSYILDDHTYAYLKVDPVLLANSSYGIYVSNSRKITEIRQTVNEIAKFGMQSGSIGMSDIINIMRQDSLIEAEELLRKSEREKQEQEQQMQQQQIQAAQEMEQQKHQMEMQRLQFERETKLMEIERKGEWDLKKQIVFSSGFAEEGDLNQNNIPDTYEIGKQLLEERKFEHQKEVDKRKLDIEEKKIEQKKAEKQANK